MDGGHKSVAVGLCDYESLRAHHDPQTIRESDSYMDPARSELNRKVCRLGKIVDEHLNVFISRLAINNRMYGSDMDFLIKNEDDFTAFDRMKFEAMRYTMSKLPRPARRKLLHSRPAQYELIACHAGKTEPVHEKIIAKGFEQYAVPVRGQADILITGIPDISPYNVYSILNPLTRAGDGAWLSLQFLSKQTAAEKGWRHDSFITRVTTISIISFTRVTSSFSIAYYRRRAMHSCFARSTSRSLPTIPATWRCIDAVTPITEHTSVLHVVLGREWPPACSAK